MSDGSIEGIFKSASCPSNTEFAKLVGALIPHYKKLGHGENGYVFEAEGKAVKIYRSRDRPYTNFVRSALFATSLDVDWTFHFPVIHDFVETEHYNIVVMEKLTKVEVIAKQYKAEVASIIQRITPNHEIYGSLQGSLLEVWGRLFYLGSLGLGVGDEDRSHFRVVETLDTFLHAIIKSCFEISTFCDLNPTNVMFRQIQGRCELVVIDPFCPLSYA